MLKASRKQGVETVIATPHFYADCEDPSAFLARRASAVSVLSAAVSACPEPLPDIRFGAEILYFPGMSEAEELLGLVIEGTYCLLIEPPMMPWSETMIDEIEQTGKRLRCIPVIAHIDRYMRVLKDPTLIDRVRDRQLLIQVNASFFLHADSTDFAMRLLNESRIHLIGSDCHNLNTRPPNLGMAASVASGFEEEKAFSRFRANAEYLLHI